MLTPLDIEREFGLTEGNIFQGELSLEQLFFLRPVPGWAQYRTPDRATSTCAARPRIPAAASWARPGRNAAMEIVKDTETEVEGRR